MMTGLESCHRKTFNVKILFSFFKGYVYTVPVKFSTSGKIGPDTLSHETVPNFSTVHMELSNRNISKQNE